VGRGRQLAKLISDNEIRDVLVLGFNHGITSCYLTVALDNRNDGHLVAVGRADKIAEQPSIEDLLVRLSVTDRATVFYEYDGFSWRLYHLMTQRPRPQFDLVFLDGRHRWESDGFAFLLAEQLLAPAGYIIFAALNWSLAGSPSLAPQTTHVPDDIRNAQHVKLICDELVKPHPNIAEYWEDSHWGFARKRRDGYRMDDQSRDAALDVVREQALVARRRAERAWKQGSAEGLAAPHPLTGAHFKPAREHGG
jgi:predicted O-methyltransferase YrrM